MICGLSLITVTSYLKTFTSSGNEFIDIQATSELRFATMQLCKTTDAQLLETEYKAWKDQSIY